MATSKATTQARAVRAVVAQTGANAEDSLSGQEGMFDSQPSLTELGGKPAAVGSLQHLREIVRQSTVAQSSAVAVARSAILSDESLADVRQALLDEVGASDVKSLGELDAALNRWWKKHSSDRVAHKNERKQQADAFEYEQRMQGVDDILEMGRQAGAEWDAESARRKNSACANTRNILSQAVSR
jgi:hypothetical protein